MRMAWRPLLTLLHKALDSRKPLVCKWTIQQAFRTSTSYQHFVTFSRPCPLTSVPCLPNLHLPQTQTKTLTTGVAFRGSYLRSTVWQGCGYFLRVVVNSTEVFRTLVYVFYRAFYSRPSSWHSCDDCGFYHPD